jgi:O-antigen/teichoic acid export membrane protein
LREQLKALSKETLIYGVSTVIGRFLNFLLVPFYVNVLRSSVEYGVATSLYTYISFFTILYTMGLEAAYFRYAAKGENEHRSIVEEKRLFSSPFLLVVIVGGLLTALLLLAASWLVYPVFHDPKLNIGPMTPMLTAILRYGALILLFDSLNYLPFAILRLNHRAKWFATIRLVNILLTLTLNFVFILGFHWGVEGIFLANLISSATMLAMLIPTIVRYFEFRIARDVLRTMLPFGLTNVPAYLAAMMVQVIDRPIVQSLLGLAVLGVYQANYRMGFTMMVFVSLFEYAWRPFFLRQARTDDARARLIFSRVFTYFMLIAVFAFVFLSFVLPYVVATPLPLIHHRIFQRTEYLQGIGIIPIVLAAYIFQGMYTNFIAGIYIKEHNKVLPWITGLGAVVNILSNLLLIPVMGITGAAFATLFAYMAMAGALYVQAQKVYFIPYDWKRVGLLILIGAVTFGLDQLIVHARFLESASAIFGERMLLFSVAIGALFLTGFFSKGELAALKQVVGRGRSIGSSEPGTPEPIELSQERREDK